MYFLQIQRNAKPRMLLLLSVIFLFNPKAVSDDVITILAEQGFPFSYTESGSDEGKVIGYGAEFVKSVLEEAQLEYTLNIVPWKRAMNSIERLPNVMVIPMARTSFREKKYHWVGEVVPVNLYLYSKKQNASRLPRNLEDAKLARIGVTRGDVAENYLLSKGFTNLTQVKKISRTLLLLDRGRISFFPFNILNFKEFALRNGRDPDNYVPLIHLKDISLSLNMALSLNTSPEIVVKLKEAYQRVKEREKAEATAGSAKAN